MVTMVTRRKHRWWKQVLRMEGRFPLGLIMLTVVLALGVAALVILVAQ